MGASYPFRVTRDADVAIEEDEASDLIEAMEEQLDQRDFTSAVRLELDATTPEHIREILMRNLQLPPYLVYTGTTRSVWQGFANSMRLNVPT